MDGLLPVWKPTDITSYDVIREWKRTYGRQIKIGHAGTLDPFAEGVLILMLGRATKKFDTVTSWRKTYYARARLGALSSTLDRQGMIAAQADMPAINMEMLRSQAAKMLGRQRQIIPDFSAAKVGGVPRYKLARAGKKMELKEKEIEVYELNILGFADNFVDQRMTVSSGTYIRQLSYDLLKSLGVDSYLDTLVREKVGEIAREDCIDITELQLKERVLSRLIEN